MCGIFGAVTPGMDAAAMAALGVFSLQHRGQESAGIAVSDGEQLMLYKDLGLIAQVLDERRLPSLRGSLAISHCRYSTTGSTIWENAQPTFRMGRGGSIAIGHNGNLVNTRELAGQAGGRQVAPARNHRHGAPHCSAGGRSVGGHGRGAETRPAGRPGRLLTGNSGREAGHRGARSARLPAARPRSDRARGRRPGGRRTRVAG